MNFKRGLIRLCTVASVLYVAAVSTIGFESTVIYVEVLASVPELTTKKMPWSAVGNGEWKKGGKSVKVKIENKHGVDYTIVIHKSFLDISPEQRAKGIDVISDALGAGKKSGMYELILGSGRYERARRKIRDSILLVLIPPALLWAFLYASFWVARGFTEKGKI